MNQHSYPRGYSLRMRIGLWVHPWIQFVRALRTVAGMMGSSPYRKQPMANIVPGAMTTFQADILAAKWLERERAAMLARQETGLTLEEINQLPHIKALLADRPHRVDMLRILGTPYLCGSLQPVGFRERVRARLLYGMPRTPLGPMDFREQHRAMRTFRRLPTGPGLSRRTLRRVLGR